MPFVLPLENSKDSNFNPFENFSENDKSTELLKNLSPHELASVDILEQSLPYLKSIEDWIKNIINKKDSILSTNIFTATVATLELGQCQVKNKNNKKEFDPLIPFMHRDGEFSIHLKVKEGLSKAKIEELEKSLCEYLQNKKLETNDSFKSYSKRDFLNYFTKPKNLYLEEEQGMFYSQLPWIAKNIEDLWNQHNKKNMEIWSSLVKKLINDMETKFNIQFKRLPPEINNSSWTSIYLIASPVQRKKMRQELVSITEALPLKFKKFGVKLSFDAGFDNRDWSDIETYHKFLYFFYELNSIDEALGNKLKNDGLKSIEINCNHGIESFIENGKEVSRDFLVDFTIKIKKSTYGYSAFIDDLINKKVKLIEFIKEKTTREK